MTRNGASYVKIGSCIEEEKSNTETLFRPPVTPGCFGESFESGMKVVWALPVPRVINGVTPSSGCVYSPTILPDIYGNVVKRQFLVELGVQFSPSATLSLVFSFFWCLLSPKSSPFRSGRKKKKEKKDRSRCQRTKRLETLPTLCFKAIYTLIERRSDARNKAVPSHFWVYTTANGCTCVLFCNKISGSRRSLLVARVEKEEKRRERKWRWSWSISQVQRKKREISLMWFDVKWYFSADRYHLLLHTGCFIYYRLKYLGYDQLHVLCDYSQNTTFRFVSTLLV